MLPSISKAKLRTGAGVSTTLLKSKIELFVSHFKTSNMGALKLLERNVNTSTVFSN
jgi:hypothetical protein